MGRRTPSYFICPKWNFAPAARRQANRAMRIIEHAKTHVWDAHPADDVWGDDPALRMAMAILEGAGRQISDWETAQHAAAKAAQMEAR